jgi:NADPH:quinone reductase-like Zn-dependent oxidoreductase
VRAARIHHYGPPDVFVIDDVPEPEPKPRDVLVRVHASSVNPVDTKLRAGAQKLLVRYRLPWILGLDVSGVVEAVGARVRRFRVGQQVFGSPRHQRPGCYAEYVAVDERELAPKPSSLSHEQAAAVPLAALTAWDCLVEQAKLDRGERVLIHAGSGGVGSFAIQLAKHLGAIVATTCSGRNAELVRELGADRVVDYSKEQFEEVLAPQHVVLDPLGWASVARSLAILERGGHLTSIQPELPKATARYGQLSGALVTGLKMAGLPLRGLWRGVRARNLMAREPSGTNLAEIGKLIEQGEMKPVIDRVIPLADIAEAHRHSETGRARGKIVIAVR